MNIKNLIFIAIFAGITGSLSAMEVADRKPATKEEFLLAFSEDKPFNSMLDPKRGIIWNDKKYIIKSCKWTTRTPEDRLIQKQGLAVELQRQLYDNCLTETLYYGCIREQRPRKYLIVYNRYEDFSYQLNYRNIWIKYGNVFRDGLLLTPSLALIGFAWMKVILAKQ